MTKTFSKDVRCFVCGNTGEPLEHIQFEEWVCEKDKKKIMSYIIKLKNRANKHTRYKDIESFTNAHKLNNDDDIPSLQLKVKSEKNVVNKPVTNQI